MKTLKSGPSSDSPESPRFKPIAEGGGAVILKNSSNVSASPNPMTPSVVPLVWSPQTIDSIN